VNLFFAGILAGQEIVIHYGIRTPAQRLDERSQLQLRKALVLRLRVLIPGFFLPTALTGIAVLVLSGDTRGVWFRWAAVLSILVWVAVRIIGTIPINSATIDWQIDAPPKDWRALVDRAERFHIVGVWAAVLAFACWLAAVALTVAGG
jgi:hypothetical protein